VSGGEEICVQGFGGDLRERHEFKNLGVDGRIILKVSSYSRMGGGCRLD
jgi:hypothetical protein